MNIKLIQTDGGRQVLARLWTAKGSRLGAPLPPAAWRSRDVLLLRPTNA
jgi:hypothetical protein